MDIDRLAPIPDTRPATGDSGDLLGRLRAAGSVEAEVIRVLKDQLLLRSELGEILTRNRLDLRPGDRVRIRLSGSESEPVLKVRPAPRRPATIATAEVPRLAAALPADRPALAEILRVSPRSTEIRIAGQRHSVPLRIDTAAGSLLSLERRSGARSITLQPLPRAPLYRALLRQLLPRQASDDADSLIRLLDRARPHSATTTPASVGTSTRSEVASRAPAATPSAAAAPASPRIATSPVNRAPQVVADEPPSPPAGLAGSRPSAASSARSGHAEPVLPGVAVGERRSAPAGNSRGAPSPGVLPSNPPVNGSAVSPATRIGSLRYVEPLPPQRPRRDAAARLPADAAIRSPGDAAIRPRSAAAAPVWANRVPAPESAPGIAPGTTPAIPSREAPVATPAPLAQLLDWLPRTAELDAPRLRHWIELLGFARPPATDGTRLPDLVDWLRQLLSFDQPSRNPGETAGRRSAPPGPAETPSAAIDNRDAFAAPTRESLRLAEQALTHNLLQRAAAGLQQETQQPINLNLTLPFLDGAEIRPLRLELEQRGRRGEAGGDPAWDLRVTFEFGDLGPVSCHLVLAGRALAASFYCELETTRERIATALPELRRDLGAAGFDPGELHSFVGSPRAPQPTAALAAEFLIDLEA